MRESTVAIMTGIPMSDIKEMIDLKYGSCVWAIDSDGNRVCYPLDFAMVVVKSTAPEERSEK